MDMNNVNIEEIVKQVLAGMAGTAPAASASAAPAAPAAAPAGAIPKTAHVATRVLFIDDGKIQEQNAPKEFFENPQNPRLKEFLSKVL